MSLAINKNDTVIYQGTVYTVSSMTVVPTNVGGVFRDVYTIVPTSGQNIVANGYNIVIQNVGINNLQTWIISK